MFRININELTSCLKDLANEEFQRLAWLSTGAYPVSSFTEDLCQLFDDTGLSDLLEKGVLSEQLGQEVTREFLRLRKMMLKIDQSLSPQEILDLPEMKEVRRQAAVVLEAILKAEELLDGPRKYN